MGFLSCLGLGRTRHRPRVPRGGDTPAESPPATVNSWTAYRDTSGRPCWRNNLTGLWTYSPPNGGNTNNNIDFFFVQPPQQFWPVSPYPSGFHHPPPWSGVVPPSPVLVFPAMPRLVAAEGKKEDKKEENKEENKEDKKEKGHWEEVFSERDGSKIWRHTGTKKTRRSDPFI